MHCPEVWFDRTVRAGAIALSVIVLHPTTDHFHHGDGVSCQQLFNCGSLSFVTTQGDYQHRAPCPVTAAGFGDYRLFASRTARS
jgi:hypothetical protein